jgi:hypothetical protein
MRFLECAPEIVGPHARDVVITVEPCRQHLHVHQDGALIKEVLGARAAMTWLHMHLYASSLAERPRAALLHAACLRRHGRRLLLAGAKGTGKTTLSLLLVAAGFEFEGDENVLIEEAGVVARPRACRVKETSLALLGSLAAAVSASPSYRDHTGHIYNFDPRTLGSTWRIESGEVDCVVVLQPNHGGYSSIRPMPPSAVVQALMSEIGVREEGRSRPVAALALLARRAKGFDLSLGDLEGAVRCIERATRD